MNSGSRLRHALLSVGAALALAAAALVGSVSTAGSALAASLPCDIYASGGTPCVAAHSLTRALFASYTGPLYQVQRSTDGATSNVGLLSAGGYANAAAQDLFCSGAVCRVIRIYDQTSRHNDLTVEGPGGNGAQDYAANAAALPVTAGGHKVYGLYVSAGVGYRDNATSGVATGSQPEGMYMVTAGQHYNDRCCFDYGNAETSGNDTGNGHMDAINFSNECWFSCPQTSGPMVQGDLENGLFQGGNGSWSANTGRSSTFVTAMLKDNGTTTYAIKDGNAQSGSLTTRYSGALPSTGGYTPMHLEGSIVLGTGGDNSNGSVGSFFEGVMTAGYPSDATESAVQANIVSVGYATSTTFPVAGTKYRITNVNSGKVLDAVNCGTANGTRLDLWSSLGNTCQQWTFSASSEGTWTVTNVNSGKVLDAVNCGQADGTEADLWSALGNTCQRWDVVPAGNGRYMLVVRNSGMVLDAANCGTANGTDVRLWQWLDNTCQEWTIAP
ncbi:ricin-type beta-trefoil lectin protein [Motilibacter rhizosphaerae]|uniref:Ricin-type beta-trefoil lectin protein n=1 Tax=Motilibacter rhizosphaerae TaxID=598652 RepID=A0A4Q7NWL6_9ACTN|nr:arabinofuranosidase catalytic domain-containing protein [Motilibacter rhizosphaerae]RZS91716.1 ricin-type beta-trefoil lectin protein [Motilibacter rhizosphaerae]